MSAIPETLRRQWLPLSAALAVCLAGALTWLAASQTRPGAPLDPPRGAVSSLPQAPWKVDVSLEGRVGKLTPFQKRAFNRERPRVVALIEEVYEGMFLVPDLMPEVVAKSFTPAATKSLRPSRLGLPSGIARVQIRRRVARVGIQATGSRAAAADVTVVARGKLDARKVKVAHTSTLWMSRDNRNWKVIGFDVRQRPLK